MYNVFGNDYYAGYHYKIYCVLGDPSIHIWKDVPQAVTVTYPASIPFGNNLVEFTVTHTATGLPVSNAEVCVSGTTIFATGTTDATGKAYLDLFSEVAGNIKSNGKGRKCNSFPRHIGALLSLPGHMSIRETYSMNDISGGNGNGLFNYGKSILMSLSVKNVGTRQANNVNVTLSTTDPFITITDNVS